ncbi:hypothetical protein E3O42_05020 [Cryobacterium adonitolivorans]|uniref:VOC domain-containing protein n=1 Tax=Cryobacterium adonitolivorans TaxID=1259189 RepID=A0A4R8W9L0_9MICO|nr:VOC family protein [Cryobacterium adonitolivorans]TFC04516.1 hypothetical protein E3O42_05020 [Cryobacterium adonitolivorans]
MTPRPSTEVRHGHEDRTRQHPGHRRRQGQGVLRRTGRLQRRLRPEGKRGHAVRGVQMVVADADAARAQLVAAGVEASEVDEQDWGRFVYFADPDGNTWSLQQLPPPA